MIWSPNSYIKTGVHLERNDEGKKPRKYYWISFLKWVTNNWRYLFYRNVFCFEVMSLPVRWEEILFVALAWYETYTYLSKGFCVLTGQFWPVPIRKKKKKKAGKTMEWAFWFQWCLLDSAWINLQLLCEYFWSRVLENQAARFHQKWSVVQAPVGVTD